MLVYLNDDEIHERQFAAKEVLDFEVLAVADRTDSTIAIQGENTTVTCHGRLR